MARKYIHLDNESYLVSILIFDSGIGGLSIRREIQKLLPNLTIHQFADHAWMPYGTKETSEITKRVTSLIPELVLQLEVELVVLACNTASTQTLPSLRSLLDCPVIGVVPAVKPACSDINNATVGLLATSSTIASNYTRQLIADYSNDNSVKLLDGDPLVLLAERKLLGETVQQEVTQVIDDLLSQGCHKFAKIILACTHFPILKGEIANALPKTTQLLDSGEAIARRVQSLLNTPNNKDRARFLSSGSISAMLEAQLSLEGFYWIDENIDLNTKISPQNNY